MFSKQLGTGAAHCSYFSKPWESRGRIFCQNVRGIVYLGRWWSLDKVQSWLQTSICHLKSFYAWFNMIETHKQ